MKKFRIVENDYENGLGNVRAELDLKLTPVGANVKDVVTALNNPDHYGKYLSNLRSKKEVEDAIIAHFGPSHPIKRKAAEKERGEKFPVKTKQAIDDLVRSLSSKTDILKYDVDGDTLIFPSKKNQSQQSTKNILKQVLGSAGIKYKLTNVEDFREYRRSSKLSDLLNEKK